MLPEFRRKEAGDVVIESGNVGVDSWASVSIAHHLTDELTSTLSASAE
jgi:hypothetical protein